MANLEFDAWMTRRPLLDSCNSIADLGFGQLNDLLLVMNFPEMAEEFYRSANEDERNLRCIADLTRRGPFRDFGVTPFILEVERRIRRLASRWAFWLETGATVEALLESLCMIAYSIERWSQAVLRHPPGQAVNSFYLGESSESLHSFLFGQLGNYNTLEHFALRSVGTTDGIFEFRFLGNTPVKQGIRKIKSAYKELEPYADSRALRFPSTLDMTPFLEVIKKGELAAQVYNDLALELLDVLRRKEIGSDEAIALARSVSLGMRIGKQAIIDFLGDEKFSTGKFIYILRQFTVELDTSPADRILHFLSLDTGERITAKGFLNHYLYNVPAEGRSRSLVAWEWLRNEGVKLPSLTTWLQELEPLDLRGRVETCRARLHQTVSQTGNSVVLAAIADLFSGSHVGIGRIRYATELFRRLLPRLDSTLSAFLNDGSRMAELEEQLRVSTYALAPSGANSLAFFGGDVLLGLVSEITNYRTHLLCRLPIMLESDRERFWKLVQSDFAGLPALLRKVFGIENPPTSYCAGESCGEHARSPVSLNVRNVRLAPYYELINAFADLSKAHNASVEKFLRRVSNQMERSKKERLISSPEHGSTFMQPSSVNAGEDARLVLPSLDKLNSVRTANQRMAVEFLTTIGVDYRHDDLSPEFIRSFFLTNANS